jgi:DNA-binding NtrC family response regulator
MATMNEIGDPMSKHKMHFEVIKQADIAPLLHNHNRILSLTYDPSLARTRELLFTRAGFEVSTFTDVAKATAACREASFDLVVLGHCIPLAEKRALAKEVAEKCSVPVLALMRHGEPRMPEADYFFESLENPALLLEMIIKILRPEESKYQPAAVIGG